MKNILVINDNSAAATNAAEFALSLAQKMPVNILLATMSGISNKVGEKVEVDAFAEDILTGPAKSGTYMHLQALKNPDNEFVPVITEFDSSAMDEHKIAELINKNQIWMMVKGVPGTLPSISLKKNLNVHAVLNNVLCPLLLLPENWTLKPLERMVYIADLRYCRIQIVRFLAELARPWRALLSIAHLTAKGLPDMHDKYALSIFKDGVCPNVNYDRLVFNNVKEKNLSTAVDVMINGMHNDLLVLVNHHFHIEEILGRYITDILPESVTIPLLIFPY
jgi:hypothetical protein